MERVLSLQPDLVDVMDLWTKCGSSLPVMLISGELLRMVESQQQVATLSLVDTLAEQALLETLIERSKPPLPAGGERLHYLLATPFRYPPLRHGSRFGSRFEPALFYGSKRLSTLLAEVAYYRFVFWTGMTRPPPDGRLVTQHSCFAVRWRNGQGVRLQEPPCDAHQAVLRHPADYGPTQAFGSALRAAGVGAFEFASARDLEAGTNIALFTPSALVSRAPLRQRAWFCETRAEVVSFASADAHEVHDLPWEWFLVDGRLPRPPA
jgi:hypothetical protein